MGTSPRVIEHIRNQVASASAKTAPPETRLARQEAAQRRSEASSATNDEMKAAVAVDQRTGGAVFALVASSAAGPGRTAPAASTAAVRFTAQDRPRSTVGCPRTATIRASGAEPASSRYSVCAWRVSITASD